MSATKSSLLLPRYVEEAEKLRSNPGQWEVYQSSGNCVVLAGPGSGKTKTLTVKLARMLREDVRAPRGIACITYSTECARELKRRLAALGVYESESTFIGTVHGFCLNHVLRPFGILGGLPLPKELKVPGEKMWFRLFEQALDEARMNVNPREWKTPFERYRRTTLNRAPGDPYEGDDEEARLLAAFERLLHGAGYVDFDDMVLYSLALIRNHDWVRRALKARFPILVVDEYQDLGPALDEIVRQLCFRAGVRVLAVGDPDQSIYGFTGADPDLLVDLAGQSSVQPVRLRLNYRCGKTIVVSSLVTLKEQRGYEAALDHEGTITFWECPGGIEEQATTIVKQIVPLSLNARAGRALGDIAILYLDKYDAASMTAAVQLAGHSYIGGDREARYPATPLTRWLEDCAAWCSGGWERGSPRLPDLLFYWRNLHGVHGTWREFEKQRTLVAFLMAHRNVAEKLSVWLSALVSAGLAVAVKSNVTMTEEMDALRSLWEAASDPKRLGNFTIGDFGQLQGTSNHLNLVTLHSSKGLEFDVVIMMGLEDGRIPNFRATSERAIREARRLFYVGLTRARHSVHLVYSGRYKNAYGREFANGPSPFVRELQEAQTMKPEGEG